MSNVKRYGFPWLECDATDEAYMQENGMTELKDGGFVLWADYARLIVENERLNIELKAHGGVGDLLDADCTRLQFENELLRQAGDRMARHLVCSDLPNDVCEELMKAWNAAKPDNL